MEGEYGYPVKLDMARVKLVKEVKIKDRRIEELTQQQVYYHWYRQIDSIPLLFLYSDHMKQRK